MDEPAKQIEDVIKKWKEHHKRADSKTIMKAYEFAKRSHAQQLRKSGEGYITHPVEVAYILAELGLDDQTICAALLHDVVEDTIVTKEEVIKEFGQQVAEMVERSYEA